jgi:hypothetical protein
MAAYSITVGSEDQFISGVRMTAGMGFHGNGDVYPKITKMADY